MSRVRRGGFEHKLNHRRFCLNTSKQCLTVSLTEIALGGCRVSVLGDVQKPAPSGLPEQGVRSDDLQTSLPTSATWSFSYSVSVTKTYPTVFEIINLHSSSSPDTPHLKQANREKQTSKAFWIASPTFKSAVAINSCIVMISFTWG